MQASCRKTSSDPCMQAIIIQNAGESHLFTLIAPISAPKRHRPATVRMKFYDTSYSSKLPSALRADRTESISSMKMTAGCRAAATAKSALTIFSPSPIHLEVRDPALMLKKVALMLLAMALPIRVLPVPGGPKSSRPFGGALAPWHVSFVNDWKTKNQSCAERGHHTG